jgi:hypothetical protein
LWCDDARELGKGVEGGNWTDGSEEVFRAPAYGAEFDVACADDESFERRAVYVPNERIVAAMDVMAGTSAHALFAREL